MNAIVFYTRTDRAADPPPAFRKPGPGVVVIEVDEGQIANAFCRGSQGLSQPACYFWSVSLAPAPPPPARLVLKNLQSPTSKFQRRSKYQAPITPLGKASVWMLAIGYSLDVGCWDLELHPRQVSSTESNDIEHIARFFFVSPAKRTHFTCKPAFATSSALSTRPQSLNSQLSTNLAKRTYFSATTARVSNFRMPVSAIASHDVTMQRFNDITSTPNEPIWLGAEN